MNPDNQIQEKIRLLKRHLGQLKSGLVALSGGVDSCVLLALAAGTPDFIVEAATIVSQAHPEKEIDAAIAVARRFDVPHHLIATDELANPDIRANGPKRCYYCKYARYTKLLELIAQKSLLVVLDGSNADDRYDDRPGARAIAELNIQTPLADAALTKQDIRRIARSMNLDVWNAPSTACLYTRIPCGDELDPARLKRIETCEALLVANGFLQVRVRDHGTIARIEFYEDDIFRFVGHPEKKRIISELKQFGYTFIAIDAEGYSKGHQR